MAYTTIDDPSLYFTTKLYTSTYSSGSGSGATINVTLDATNDFAVDLVWIKCRSVGDNHVIADRVRGANKNLHPNTTDAEATNTDEVTAFGDNGFTVGNNDTVNRDGASSTYVAWCWKAGTSFSNDASATSIGDIDSTGSASDTAGFSIVQWVGTGSNAGIKHGLSTKPSMIITKPTSAVGSYYTYHKSPDATDFLKLNDNDATADNATVWNDTEPTTSVFTTGTAFDSGRTFIAYCFAEKQGYSKFGSYRGNGNADGTFCFLGFKPAFLMIKRSSNTDNWYIKDNKRSGTAANQNFGQHNPNSTQHPSANNSSAENKASAFAIDILSNGFKLRGTDAGINQSGETYIFMAFAEAPFVNSKGVPCNAR